MTRDKVLEILKDIGPVVECPRCSYGTIKGQSTHTPSCPLLEVISWLEDKQEESSFQDNGGYIHSGWLLTSPE